MSKFKFQPSLAPTIGALVLLPVFIGLGLWQLDRAQQKSDLLTLYQERLSEPLVSVNANIEDPDWIQFRRLRISGTWQDRYQFFVDNRIFNGQPGFHVITPLQIGNSNLIVLVNRGWIPAEADRSILPSVEPVRGKVTVTGIAVVPHEKPFVLQEDGPIGSTWESVWQTLNLDRFRSAVPFKVQGFVVRMDANQENGFERNWSELSDNWIHRHKAYAFQWFAFAATLLVIYLALTVRFGARTKSSP